jgi:GT2 family glycosyltransferase
VSPSPNIEAALARFFASAVFALHGAPQDRDALRRTLRNEADRFRELQPAPLISLVALAKGATPAAVETLVVSCVAQSWPHWKLVLVGGDADALPPWAAFDQRIRCVAPAPLGEALVDAGGDFAAMVDPGGTLHPQILGLLARLSALAPRPTLLYCNELALGDDATVQAIRAKPLFDRATLERVNFLGRLTLIARDLLKPTRDETSEHGLLLRIATMPELRVSHAPVFGYGSSRPLVRAGEADEGARRMLKAHFARTLSGGTPDIRTAGERGRNRLLSIAFTPEKGRRLGVIVPFRDGFALTSRCLESLERQKTSLSVHVLLVDNGSSEETRTALASWFGSSRRHRYETLRYDGAFNFAKINNAAAARICASVDFLMLLNNDVELSSEAALEVMAGELERHADTAFVGLKLLYPGGTVVQHGGIRITAATEGLGFHRAEHIVDDDELIADEHVVAAVTFAGAMCRSAVWRELGGLEETLFPNGYGDIDLCFRAIAAGYRNFYLGSVEGIHHESRTRQTQSEELEQALINERHGPLFSTWRTRSYARPVARGEEASWFERHLRYRIADAVNDALKRLIGPWHRQLRRLALRRLKAPKP